MKELKIGEEIRIRCVEDKDDNKNVHFGLTMKTYDQILQEVTQQGIYKSKATREFVAQNLFKKQKLSCYNIQSIETPKPKRKRFRKYTPKEKAEYAVTKLSENIDNPRWMQKWIDFSDKSNPLGKRRVAFVRYLTMVKKMNLDEAKKVSVRIIK